MKSRHSTAALVVILLAIAGTTGTVLAEVASPPPGSVYREIKIHISNGGNQWRVTDPDATNAGSPENNPGTYLPNKIMNFNVPAGALDNATSAIAIVDYWGGHVGTTGQQLRFNGRAWRNLPELLNTPTDSECYTQQWNPAVTIPLADLNVGANTLQGNSDGQICYNFNWGQWGWYGVVLRIFYDPASVSPPSGSIASPGSGATIGDNPTIQVTTTGAVQSVEVFARFDGPDWDGDGFFLEYHQAYHRPKTGTQLNTSGHVGTDSTSPYSVVWNTELVPDQSNIRLLARIQGTNGLWYVTPELTGIELQRASGAVYHFKPFGVPRRYWVRAGTGQRNLTSRVNIPAHINLGQITWAKMVVRTWNGVDGEAEPGQTHGTWFNNHQIPTNYGANHFYSIDVLPIPVAWLQNGDNVFKFDSTSTHHGIEILWPGPELVVGSTQAAANECGNGILESGELCDDGNSQNGDGCDNDCTSPGGAPGACGDGTLNLGEQCDDGNIVNGDGCLSNCTLPVVPDELPAMYPFEEASGNLIDDIANDNDGTLEAGAQRTNAGKYGKAIVFDGDAGRVNLGPLNLGGPFTIAMWIKAHDFGVQDARLISKAMGSADNDHFFMLSTVSSGGTRLRFRLKTTNGDTTTLIANGATLAAGAWVHVAGVWTGAEMRLFQNGVQVGSVAKSGEVVGDATVAAWIGDQPGGGTKCFDGEIDEVVIDDRAYTAAELVTLMNAPIAPGGASCGNGVLDPGEGCDDGNNTSGDGCQGNCALPACGDGVVDPGEACDDGNTASGDSCAGNCSGAGGGPGGEPGGENVLRNGDFSNGTTDWKHFTNGSGGFTTPGGEARVLITTVGSNIQLYQFNVAVAGGTDYLLRFRARASRTRPIRVELRRHGAPNELYGLSQTFTLNSTMTTFEFAFTTTPGDKTDGRLMVWLATGAANGDQVWLDDLFLGVPSSCGDGLIGGTEGCDDGNVQNGDGCDSTCRIEECGNGLVQAGEACDDGNAVDDDACGNDCVANVCGDGELNNGEDCEDGGVANGDGCDANCLEETCGNGVQQFGEQCDDGNTDDLDACGNDCVANSCGDGQVNNGEQCDDGNANDDDTCSNSCQPPTNGWHGSPRSYRVSLEVTANGFARVDKVAEQTLDFPTLLAEAGGSGSVAPSSLQLFEVSSTGDLISADVPFQLDGSTLVWLLAGNTPAGATRYYLLYFDTLAFTPPTFPDLVLVVDNLMDEGQVSFGIDTNRATYFFQKEGASFSSLHDSVGNDWIKYSTATGSAGAFRGIPNLVFPANIFHPGFTSASSTLIHDGPLRATVESPSDNGAFRTRWDFYPDYALLTVLQATGNYWFLYEGTPGGVLDRVAPNNDFLVRSDGTVYSVATTWTGGIDIPGDEWVYFGDPIVGKSLFLAHHTNDTATDWYQPLDNPAGGPASDWMTVFGFGRGPSTSSLLTGAGRQFTIGLMDTVNFPNAKILVESAYKPLAITVGPGESSDCGDGLITGSEDCDDSNEEDGDGCDSNCRTEECGNGVVQVGEACDDGNAADDDACGNDCVANVCGDGQVNNGEQCDDGNANNADDCRNCQSPRCGDTIVDPGEACDDGNMDDLDACGNDCLANVCGDGQVNNGEPCDDGNAVDDDLCSNACLTNVENTVVNGDFSGGNAPWTFYTNGQGAFSTANGFAQLSIVTGGDNIQLYQRNLAIQGSTVYRLRFRARNTAGADVSVQLRKHGAPNTLYGLSQYFNLTDAWQTFSVDFTSTAGNKTDARLMFWFGPYEVPGSTYEIDDVELFVVP